MSFDLCTVIGYDKQPEKISATVVVTTVRNGRIVVALDLLGVCQPVGYKGIAQNIRAA